MNALSRSFEGHISSQRAIMLRALIVLVVAMAVVVPVLG